MRSNRALVNLLCEPPPVAEHCRRSSKFFATAESATTRHDAVYGVALIPRCSTSVSTMHSTRKSEFEARVDSCLPYNDVRESYLRNRRAPGQGIPTPRLRTKQPCQIEPGFQAPGIFKPCWVAFVRFTVSQVPVLFRPHGGPLCTCFGMSLVYRCQAAASHLCKENANSRLHRSVQEACSALARDQAFVHVRPQVRLGLT